MSGQKSRPTGDLIQNGTVQKGVFETTSKIEGKGQTILKTQPLVK